MTDSSATKQPVSDGESAAGEARIHVLKTVGVIWDAVESGAKRFEARKNDRAFQSGDVVVLRRLHDEYTWKHDWDEKGLPRDLAFRIGFILQGGQFGIEAGHCVFQLEPISPAVKVDTAKKEGRG